MLYMLSILCCYIRSDKYRVNSPESGEEADVIHYCKATDRPNRLLITGNYSCSHILEIPRRPAVRPTDWHQQIITLPEPCVQSVSLTAFTTIKLFAPTRPLCWPPNHYQSASCPAFPNCPCASRSHFSQQWQKAKHSVTWIKLIWYWILGKWWIIYFSVFN